MQPEISHARTDSRLVIIREAVAVKRNGARVEAVLAEDYQVTFTWRGARWSLTVPKGFLAAPSVPPTLHGVVPFWGALFEASIAHDWCYWTHCFEPLGNRETADHLLYALMRAGGASVADAVKVYAAVSAFGYSHYTANAFIADNHLVKMP